ncbi:MAG TPA: MBL fold metallo-hydrolase [Burkholderiales bacterium]|nr:MBL fold metallo-hydrolase [Burkholderiales bacterium]
MFFKQLATKDSSLSYLFGCAGHGKAVAVDVVAGDEDWFVEEAGRAKAAITHVIDTHVHADHVSGGRRLAAMLDAAYCLHESAAGVVKFPFAPLRDNQLVEAGNVLVRVMHTPGHTPESISLLVTDKRRGQEPWFVLTGDTLFVGAVGRPDLLGREREMAGMLFDTLQTRLLTLPDTIEIFPGHQAGSVCGAGLSGKPCSTLGFEKRWNPALSIRARDEFIAYLTRDIPPRPANMERIIAVNTTEGATV